MCGRFLLHAPVDVLQRAFGMAHVAGFGDPTGGATHFLAPLVLARRGQTIPAWTRGLERTARIGGHHFYRRPIRVGREP